MVTDPKHIVARGFDQIGERYVHWARQSRVQERQRYTSFVLDHLPPQSRVLDLGCGTGIPTTAALAHQFRVTGVDISTRQIELARQKVPQARFLQEDFSRLDFAPASFEAVVAFYSLFCLPRRELPPLLHQIASWLCAGGYFVASLGAQSVEECYVPDWLGVPMYWSLFESATNQRLIEEAGLQIKSAREETEEEDGVPVTFLWIVAQKPADLPHQKSNTALA
jgi:SAM-dependent methyltransferase